MFPSTQPSPMAAGLAERLHSRFGGGGGRVSRFGGELVSRFSSRFSSRLTSHFGATAGGGSTELSSLSPSLLQDLMRFERSHGEQRELLEVLAACVRHTQSLAVRLDTGAEWVTLSIFPLERLVHCKLPLDRALAGALNPDGPGLRVVQVQPATHRPPVDVAGTPRSGLAQGYAPLAPMMWAVALAGSRAELLPELSGQAAYRIAPGLQLAGLPVPDESLPAIARLRRETCNLRDLARLLADPGRPGRALGEERAVRLLNALYLQSALIVSRTHPAATNEGWAGYRARR